MQKLAYFFAPFSEDYDKKLCVELAGASVFVGAVYHFIRPERRGRFLLCRNAKVLAQRPNCKIFFAESSDGEHFKIRFEGTPIENVSFLEEYPTLFALIEDVKKHGFVLKTDYNTTETERKTIVL